MTKNYHAVTIDPRAVHVADTVGEDETSPYFGRIRPVEVIELNAKVEDHADNRTPSPGGDRP